MEMHKIILAAATVLSALMSGFFFAYTFSVSAGLHKLNDRAYLAAMQHINKAVLNPVFFVCFFGAFVFLVIASVLCFNIGSPGRYLVFGACICYAIGVLGITVARNVPLNNQLASFDIENAPESSLQHMRAVFEAPWVFWNDTRTLACFVAVVCLVISLIWGSGD